MGTRVLVLVEVFVLQRLLQRTRLAFHLFLSERVRGECVAIPSRVRFRAKEIFFDVIALSAILLEAGYDRLGIRFCGLKFRTKTAHGPN